MWTVSHFSPGSTEFTYTHDAIEHPIKGSWIAFGGCEMCLVGLKAIIANEPQRYTFEQLKRYEAWSRAWDEHDLPTISALSDINHYGIARARPANPETLGDMQGSKVRAEWIDEAIPLQSECGPSFRIETLPDGTRVPVPPNPYGAQFESAIREKRVQWSDTWSKVLDMDDVVRSALEAKGIDIADILGPS